MTCPIWGSADGQDFGKQPILKIPQRFYRGETRAILDLTTRPELNFIRAHWDLVRWGRVAPHPMFVFGLRLEEVSAFRPPARGDRRLGDSVRDGFYASV